MKPAVPIVLIVEDDAPIREMYKFKLESAGYAIATAVDGVDGLEKIKSIRPDLILLDLKMPNMDGTTFLKCVRQDSRVSNCKVVVLTNISKSEAPMELSLLRVNRYIVKAHTTPAEVLSTVQDLLKIGR